MIAVIRECKKITEIPLSCADCPYHGIFWYDAGEKTYNHTKAFCKITDRPLFNLNIRHSNCPLREIK